MRRTPAFALAAALAVLVVASALASPVATHKAWLYKVTLDGKGTATIDGQASDADVAHSLNRSHQTASWTFRSAPTRIWLVANDTLKAEQTEASASVDPSGTSTINADESFTYFDHTAPQTPLQGSSTCHGSVRNEVTAKYTANATKGGTTLDVDLAGAFTTSGHGGLACDNSPAKRAVDGQPTGPSVWGFSWDPEQPETDANQRMQLGATIHPFQLGLRSISPILTDYSLVKNAAICTAIVLTSSCDVTFKLSGELELTRVCATTVAGGASPSCGGSTGKSTPPPTKTTPPPGGGSTTHAPPTITALQVTPSSSSLSQTAHITYHVDQDGTKTLFQVTKPMKVPALNKTIQIPVEAFQHTNSARVVSFALPKSFAGHALAPGHYTLAATPLSSTTGNGKQVTTTFNIT